MLYHIGQNKKISSVWKVVFFKFCLQTTIYNSRYLAPKEYICPARQEYAGKSFLARKEYDINCTARQEYATLLVRVFLLSPLD